MLTVRLDSNVPLVDQLVTGIRCAIARRELRRGDALPTVRQLAADLGINMNTVSRAYRVLESTGLVRTLRGRGTTVAAEQETASSRSQEVKPELAMRVRAALSDFRLAGFDRQTTRLFLEEELDKIWSEES